PGRSHHMVLICCVFIPQESDSATALKVTPHGCDGKLGQGHKRGDAVTPACARKGLSMLLLTPPALVGRAPCECFANRIN
ncbi:hypothetical protein N309_06126, partial [Tinamus guttatus]